MKTEWKKITLWVITTLLGAVFFYLAGMYGALEHFGDINPRMLTGYEVGLLIGVILLWVGHHLSKGTNKSKEIKENKKDKKDI